MSGPVMLENNSTIPSRDSINRKELRGAVAHNNEKALLSRTSYRTDRTSGRQAACRRERIRGRRKTGSTVDSSSREHPRRRKWCQAMMHPISG